MKVDITKFWVEGVLKDYFADFQTKNGADLDKNGKTEGSEVFGDLNQNGVIGDREDYQLYLEKNRNALSNAVPFFKYGEKLSVRNRIHQLMYLESDLHDAALIEGAYEFLADLTAMLVEAMDGMNLSNQELAEFIYDGMQMGMRIIFANQHNLSFVNNIRDHQLDCDTSSFATIAVGDEIGLTFATVAAPNHIFLRGIDKDGHVFNIDFGDNILDSVYRSELNIHPKSEEQGAFLITQSNLQLESLFLFNRGNTLVTIGELRGALAAFDRATQLDPNNTIAHHNRGIILEEWGQLSGALAAFDRAIQIDPNSVSAHNGRGFVLSQWGQLHDALMAYNCAIQIDPTDTTALHNRAVVLRKLGWYYDSPNAWCKSW